MLTPTKPTMGLTGYVRVQERPAGGLAEVWLVSVNDVEGCVYDGSADAYISVILRSGAVFHRYEFAEDRASYRQWMHGEAPHGKVVHELSLSLARADAVSSAAISEIMGEECGAVAVVRNSYGESLLAGWSPEFEQEFPLKPSSLVWDTCSRYGEDSLCTITLRAVDVSFSKPFTGDVPGRDAETK